VLEELVEAVRVGESRALVVRGEPGVGKSALLEHVAEQGSGCGVVRTWIKSPPDDALAAGLAEALLAWSAGC